MVTIRSIIISGRSFRKRYGNEFYEVSNVHDSKKNYEKKNVAIFTPSRFFNKLTHFKYIRKATVPDYATVDKIPFIADNVTLGPQILICDSPLWNVFSSFRLYKEIVTQRAILPYIPTKYITPAIYKELILYDYSFINLIPKDSITPEMFLEMLKPYNPNVIKKFIPKKNVDILFKAVKKEGMVLKHIPLMRKTHKMCVEAVKQYGVEVLQFIPRCLRSYEIYEEIVKYGNVGILDVPYDYRTGKIASMLMNKFINAHNYVELCASEWHRLVKENGYALRKVPKCLKTYEMCLNAVKNVGGAFEFVPQNMRTEELYIEAIKENVLVYRFIPSEDKTHKMEEVAVNINPTERRFGVKEN